MAGLIILSLVEASPWVIRAWMAPAIRFAKPESTVVWTREPEPLKEDKQN